MAGIDFLLGIQDGTVPLSNHMRHLGLRLSLVTPGRVELTWEPGPALLNRSGVVHGGYIAGALDDACSMAGGSAADRPTLHLTMNLNVDYIRPLRPGTIYTVTGTLTHRGNTRLLAHATITSPDTTLHAQATASLTPSRSPAV
ncbi:PaaI family thioesterase [Nonomuraea sediminis]|uniref:PaaI family thioesterase n=1 Tax=Nonomuraea sediminis TaxID=2835864 RepID=UPI002029CF23|nr:PaaI family thioesterase [Nonomuraea sediminis]